MRFLKGGRYRRSEVEGLPPTPIILCVVVSVSRLYVTQLFEVETDFKNVFTLKTYTRLRCYQHFTKVIMESRSMGRRCRICVLKSF